jgi:hypothetical protein
VVDATKIQLFLCSSHSNPSNRFFVTDYNWHYFLCLLVEVLEFAVVVIVVGVVVVIAAVVMLFVELIVLRSVFAC